MSTVVQRISKCPSVTSVTSINQTINFSFRLLVRLFLLSLALIITDVVSAADTMKTEVSIPPLLEEGTPSGELLFNVIHDPEQGPHNLTISCKADALPLPSYSWFKDGRHFSPEDEGVHVVEGEGTLVFPDPKQEDEGDYQCVATNSAGSVFSDIVHVRRSMIISFPKGEPRVITAVLGQPLALRCDNPGGYPVPALHWVLQESDGSLHSVSSERTTMDNEGTLWFGTITLEDASDDALYACAASSATSERLLSLKGNGGVILPPENGDSDDGKFVSLTLSTEYRMGNWVYLNVTTDATVGEPQEVEPFLQKVSEEEEIVLEGDDLRLFCIYGGNPIPKIRWWRKNRKAIPENQVTDYGKALEFTDVSPYEEGTYYCQASNEIGKGEIQSFKVTVEAAPTFNEEPGTISQPIGESATFRCSAKGIPQPVITWSINGEPLEGNNDETLRFNSLDMDDKGVIACNASNDHGYVYSTGFLNVESLPPEFTIQPDDVSGFLGESVTIPCKGYGAPDPRVLWMKIPEQGREERIHRNDEQYQISRGGLVIKSLNEETEGHYKCTIVNKYGSVSEVVSVELKKSTVVNVGMSSNRAKAGDSITIRCDITVDDGINVDVQWMKNDEPIDLDDNRIIDKESDEEFGSPFDRILVIRNSRGSDSGVYTCISRTDQDEAEDDVVLTVEDAPNPPNILDIECLRREAYIRWSVPGQNTSPIIGYIVESQTELHEGKWEEIENEISPSEESIKVKLNPGLRHTFRVIAVNRAGSSPPSSPSDICTAPGAVPDYNPVDVNTEVVDSSTIHVSWKVIAPKEHNGPDFRYVVSWKRVNDDADDDVTDDNDDHDDMTFVEDEDDRNEWQKLVIEDWEQADVEIDGLRAKTRYKLRVIAANEYGSASTPEDIWVSTDPEAPVLSPTFLRVRRVSATTAILFWIPVPVTKIIGNIKGYEVDIQELGKEPDESEDGKEDEELIAEGQTSHAELTGLKPFTKYEARVRVRSSKITGPYSKRFRFRTAEGLSSPVTNLKALTVSSDDILLTWDPPSHPRGVLVDYLIRYSPLRKRNQNTLEIINDIGEEQTKISDLKENTVYKISVIPRTQNGKGLGRESIAQIRTQRILPSKPAIPVFSWSVVEKATSEDTETLFDRDNDNDIDADDMINQNVIISDTDNDGDVDENDVLDIDNDGDIDSDDFDIADINNDGVVNRKDIEAADRDGDGDVDRMDVGYEDGDGDFDDGDGDIDAGYDNEENVILQDVDRDGDIDEDDAIDVDKDGDIDDEDLAILDMDNDGDIDNDDLEFADKDKDGDVDAADIMDLDGDGKIDEDDFNVKDIDGDGDIDRMDFIHRNTFVGDTDGDGDVDNEDLTDIDGDGDIDKSDFDVADINNDGRIDKSDVEAADRDGDGDVDATDIGDEDGDGDIDGNDVILADKDGDGDIDAKDYDGKGVIFEDRDHDGDIDEDDVIDMDGDGDVDSDDFYILDVNDDGKIDADDLAILDKDNDGDVDNADIADYNQDGKIDKSDFKIVDKDGDGDIDAIDVQNQGTYLKDIDNDGDIDADDVLDIDGDGDVDQSDMDAADLDDDGDVDEDDLKLFDRDGDGDIDWNDVRDIDGDGRLDEDDFDVLDRDADGDIDEQDYAYRSVFLADTDNDGDIDEDDILDTDGDGDIDAEDFDVADINNDGKIDRQDIIAGDVDGDGDIDIADIGDEDGDGDIDGRDVIAADEDGDGDIDAEDDDGDSVLLTDRDKDGDIDIHDIIDVDGDGDIDKDDINALDIDNDGDVDEEDLRRGDKDGDGDIDAADIHDVDGDGDVDGRDIIMSDRDGDGDIDASDKRNRLLILGDSDGDGNINSEDVLDTDRDGDIDQDDFSAADINNDGKITREDIMAADLDGDGDVDAQDIQDIDGDGDVDADDVNAADKDGDGDIDLVDRGLGVTIVVNWQPDLTTNPGSEFYIKYRPVGHKKWKTSPVESKSLTQELPALSPDKAYEVQMVAKDGAYETPSDTVVIGPFARAATNDPSEEAVMANANPLYMTWFIVALIVALLMFTVIVCSVWVYRRRLARVSELRAELYKDYKPPLVVKSKDADVEAGVTDKEAQEPLTAESQREQMSSLLRRQETVQSVDSFASHDDDFAEYGDESMGTTFNDDGSLIFKKE